MPEYDVDTVTKEWLQTELRSLSKSLIVLDCRSSNEFQEGHIRSAVNFSIPSLILKRLASGKIDVTSTIKCRDLKQRIQNAYSNSLFVLYNESASKAAATNDSSGGSDNLLATEFSGNSTSNDTTTTINVLHRRLKQDGCRVYCLKGMCNISSILLYMYNEYMCVNVCVYSAFYRANIHDLLYVCMNWYSSSFLYNVCLHALMTFASVYL